MSSSEKDLRTNSFVIGVQVAQRAGIVPADLMTKIKEMKKPCSSCKRKVHRDSGKLYMNEELPNLQQPKFFCHSCYVRLIKLIKLIKQG